MGQYQLKLNNKTLRRAIDKLSVGELYTYAFLVFSVKNGLGSKDSKRYIPNEDCLYEALKLYGYLRSKKTFFRHIGRLSALKLIIMGRDKTSFIDVLHRHSSNKESDFTLICYAEFAWALKNFNQHDIKGFLGYELNSAYLLAKKPIGKLRSLARLEKAVVRISNRSKFFEARKKKIAIKRQNCHHIGRSSKSPTFSIPKSLLN